MKDLKRYVIQYNKRVLLRTFFMLDTTIEVEYFNGLDYEDDSISTPKTNITYGLTNDKSKPNIWITSHKHLAEKAIRDFTSIYESEFKQTTETTAQIKLSKLIQ
jgi:hypothetical protein